MREAREGMNFIRPRSHRGRIIGGGLIALMLLVLATDCYRFDDRAFADAYARVPGGEVEVSLRGEYGPRGESRGSPYHVMVRYRTNDPSLVLVTVLDARLRAEGGGPPLVLRADSAEHLRTADGDIGWRSTNTPAPGGDSFVAFQLGLVPLAYRPVTVTGRLRLMGGRGVREVPFTATLRPAPRNELRSHFWDAAGSV